MSHMILPKRHAPSAKIILPIIHCLLCFLTLLSIIHLPEPRLRRHLRPVTHPPPHSVLSHSPSSLATRHAGSVPRAMPPDPPPLSSYTMCSSPCLTLLRVSARTTHDSTVDTTSSGRQRTLPPRFFRFFSNLHSRANKSTHILNSQTPDFSHDHLPGFQGALALRIIDTLQVPPIPPVNLSIARLL